MDFIIAFLILIIVGISSLVRGNKMKKKAMQVQDEEERVALMKHGKRLLRWGQIIIVFLILFVAAAIYFIFTV
jgi:putative Mn2+ efflux pump MntP